MISDRDVWQSAVLLVKRYGDDARITASRSSRIRSAELCSTLWLGREGQGIGRVDQADVGACTAIHYYIASVSGLLSGAEYRCQETVRPELAHVCGLPVPAGFNRNIPGLFPAPVASFQPIGEE
jgi:hypothetical protein